MCGSQPILQLRSSSVLVYYEHIFSKRYSNIASYRSRMRSAQKQQYSGTMTDGSRKRLSRAVTIMAQACKPRWVTNEITGQLVYHKFSFCTLTISSRKNLTGRQAYDNLMAHFLQWLRRTKGVKCYLWKVELQKRGQPHYHITFPDWIHYKEIRSTWNRLQREAGLLDEYAKEHGHFDPPSTDIRETRGVDDMAGYMLKELAKDIDARIVNEKAAIKAAIAAGELPEMTKEEIAAMARQKVTDECKVEGKVWGCSDNLAGIPYFSVPLSNHAHEVLTRLQQEGAKVVKDDWFSIIYLSGISPPDLLQPPEKRLFEKHVAQVFSNN